MCRSLAGCSAERAQSAVEPRRKIARVFVLLWHTVKGLRGSGSMCTRRVSAAGGFVWPFQAHVEVLLPVEFSCWENGLYWVGR